MLFARDSKNGVMALVYNPVLEIKHLSRNQLKVVCSHGLICILAYMFHEISVIAIDFYNSGIKLRLLATC